MAGRAVKVRAECGSGARVDREAAQAARSEHHPPQFKTRVCVHFNRGHCSFGDRCMFAHGEQELRKFGPVTQVEAPTAKAPSSTKRKPGSKASRKRTSRLQSAPPSQSGEKKLGNGTAHTAGGNRTAEPKLPTPAIGNAKELAQHQTAMQGASDSSHSGFTQPAGDVAPSDGRVTPEPVEESAQEIRVTSGPEKSPTVSELLTDILTIQSTRLKPPADTATSCTNYGSCVPSIGRPDWRGCAHEPESIPEKSSEPSSTEPSTAQFHHHQMQQQYMQQQYMQQYMQHQAWLHQQAAYQQQFLLQQQQMQHQLQCQMQQMPQPGAPVESVASSEILTLQNVQVESVPEAETLSQEPEPECDVEVEAAGWVCTVCTYKNLRDAPLCEICETSCENLPGRGAQPLASERVLEEQLIQDQWECTRCTLLNPGFVGRCAACDTGKYANRVKPTAVAAVKPNICQISAALLGSSKNRCDPVSASTVH